MEVVVADVIPICMRAISAWAGVALQRQVALLGLAFPFDGVLDGFAFPPDSLMGHQVLAPRLQAPVKLGSGHLVHARTLTCQPGRYREIGRKNPAWFGPVRAP